MTAMNVIIHNGTVWRNITPGNVVSLILLHHGIQVYIFKTFRIFGILLYFEYKLFRTCKFFFFFFHNSLIRNSSADIWGGFSSVIRFICK